MEMEAFVWSADGPRPKGVLESHGFQTIDRMNYQFDWKVNVR